MPFGSGVHACPGNELAKLEMLILVHHLASQFRYNSTSIQEYFMYSQMESSTKWEINYTLSRWENPMYRLKHMCMNTIASKWCVILLSCLCCCRYELVGSESGIQYGPFPVPLHGLPARFWREDQRTKQPLWNVTLLHHIIVFQSHSHHLWGDKSCLPFPSS